MTGEILKDIPVRNKELLEILNGYVNLYNTEGFMNNVHLYCENENDQQSRDRWLSEEYLKEIIDMGQRHEGFPDHLVAYNFKPHQPDQNRFEDTADHNFRKSIMDNVYDLNSQMMFFLGVRNNALTSFYPPGGYISWHNNANAHAYNLIFSWSETGEGWFKYRNPVTGEIVHMQDHAGWQCKAGYFGHYGQPDKICYHAASTDCRRITVSFIFDISDGSLTLQDDVIEEISTE